MKADAPGRLALRVNHLVDDVRRASRNRRPPASPTLKRLVESPVPVAASDLSEDLVKEVVIEARNFLSVEFLERGQQAARCVGRVLRRTGSGTLARGTGFLVAPGLMLTNQHVLPSEAFAAECQLEMDYEVNHFGEARRPEAFALRPDLFFVADDELDYALVAVGERGLRGGSLESYGWLPLSAAQGKIAVLADDYLNIVQHPLGREKEIVLRENRVLDLRSDSDVGADQLGPFIHYEADTEKGSSGSPVFNDQWDVVALHHSGVPDTDDQGRWLRKDGQAWIKGQDPVTAICWIANEGTRVSSLVASITAAQVPLDARKYLDLFLSAQPPSVIGVKSEADDDAQDVDGHRGDANVVRSPKQAPRRREPVGARRESAGGGAVITIPLQLHITVGAPVSPVTSDSGKMRAGVPPADRALLSEKIEVADLADRDGYNRNFLGVPLPMPRLKPAPKFGSLLRVRRPARPGDKYELRYHNYSVLMNGARRLAYVSACNIDFAAPVNASREDGTSSWRLDPRIDRDEQLGRQYYDHNDYDKGHLTRRDDAAWGRDIDAAIAANNDTFFYPNAAPQHSLFNQSDEFTRAGLDLWGDLENFISAQGMDQRTKLTVLNGPVFGSSDKPFKDALVPLAYFKIVAWRDDGGPGAVGFLLDQSELVEELPEEAIEPGRFRIRQRRIADINALLDLELGVVRDWDRFDSGVDTDEALDVGEVTIERLEDIRM
jgi:endonuclease G